jgi:hypothetical protein
MLRGLQLAQPRQQAESHADRKAIEAPRKHALGWLCSAGSPSRLLLRVVVACHDSNHDSPIEKGATARSSQGQNEARESTRDHHAVRVRRCYRPRLDKLEPQNVRHFGHSRAVRLPDLPSRDRGRRLQRHSEPSRRVRMRLQGHRGRARARLLWRSPTKKPGRSAVSASSNGAASCWCVSRASVTSCVRSTRRRTTRTTAGLEQLSTSTT